MYNLKNIKDEDVKGKRVLLRVDVDVPIKDGKIEKEEKNKNEKKG